MTERKYWKPQPKPWDFIAILLLASAIASSAGFILFVSQAFIGGADGDALWVRQIGGWLLAIGGEGGTLFATLEIFRKQQSESDHVTAWDWGGLIVSALATLSGLTLAYIPTVPITESWLLWLQQRGALILLPMSVLDYYSTIMELGYRQASFGKRWEAWNDARHAWETSQQTRAKKTAAIQSTTTEDDKSDIPSYIVGPLPDTKWTEDDFARLVPDPARLTSAMRLELAVIAGVHPRTVGRWQGRADNGRRLAEFYATQPTEEERDG